MEELKIEFQNAMTLTNSDYRLIQLELCLEQCEVLSQELYYWNFYSKYKLEELRDTIVKCIIDIKLKPLW